MPNPRNPLNYCLNCNRFCKNSKSQLCRKCLMIKTHNLYAENATIESFTSTYARHKYQTIRNQAHRLFKILNVPKVCSICGYSKYVELAHIKPISSFSKDTKLSLVNHRDNLVYLCPNHHWELDNKV